MYTVFYKNDLQHALVFFNYILLILYVFEKGKLGQKQWKRWSIYGIRGYVEVHAHGNSVWETAGIGPNCWVFEYIQLQSYPNTYTLVVHD